MATQHYLVIAVAILLTGCATEKRTYRFFAGGRSESYVETESTPIDQSLASALGGTVVATVGDPNKISSQATGGQIGVLEEYKNFTSKLALFSTTYSDINYTFVSSRYGTISERLSYSATGFEFNFGYNVIMKPVKLRPTLGYKSESQTILTTVTGSGLASINNYSQRATVWGPGLSLEVPVFGNFKLLFEGEYRVPLQKPSGVSSLSYTTLQVNLMAGMAQF